MPKTNTLETGIVSYFENKFPLIGKQAAIDLTTENGEYAVVATGVDSSTAPKLIFLDISNVESMPRGAIRQLTLVDCLRSAKMLSDKSKNELTVYFNKDGIVKKVEPVVRHFSGYRSPNVGDNYKSAINAMISNFQCAIDETISREQLQLAKSHKRYQNYVNSCQKGA